MHSSLVLGRLQPCQGHVCPLVAQRQSAARGVEVLPAVLCVIQWVSRRWHHQRGLHQPALRHQLRHPLPEGARVVPWGTRCGCKPCSTPQSGCKTCNRRGCKPPAHVIDPIVTVAQRATPPNCKHWKHSTAAAAVAAAAAAAAPLLDVDVHELAAAPDRQRAHVPARAGAVLVVPS